jgi:hypothetical protein
MPLMTQQSSTGCAKGWFLGVSGSIAAQAASSSQQWTDLFLVQAETISLIYEPAADF